VYPPDTATGISNSPTLQVDVSDPDGDPMDVTFYDASDDSVIGTDTGVASGGTASTTWAGLAYNTTYSWYAVADDSLAQTTSATWSFTTMVEPTGPILFEQFEGTFPPANWTVVNNGGTCDWNTNTFYGRPNYAGGDGQCADADSDACGSGSTMDTELWTPVFSLDSKTFAELSYVSSYNDISSSTADYAYVDISTDGGTTWTNLLTWNEDHDAYGPGESVVIDLAPFAGNASCVIRFHYVAPGWDWWWEVDDVKIAPKAQHDVTVASINEPAAEAPEGNVPINATICNNGQNDETFTVNFSVVQQQSLFAQLPHDPTDSWSFGTSTVHSSPAYKMYENLAGVNGNIDTVVWYGLVLYHTGSGWVAGTPENSHFYLDFYSDSPTPPGPPSTLLASYDADPANITITNTGLTYSGYSMYKFEYTLPSSLAFTEGWLAIQNHGDPDSDYFLWASAKTGDSYSYQEGSGTPDTTYDRAVIFNPTNLLIWSDEVTVTNLPAGTCTDVEVTWPATPGNYNIIVTADLPSDENPDDNSLESAVTIVGLLDVGVDAINYPVDNGTVGLGLPMVTNATITNYGTVPALATVVPSVPAEADAALMPERRKTGDFKKLDTTPNTRMFSADLTIISGNVPLLSQGFEGSFPPAGWSITQYDGTGTWFQIPYTDPYTYDPGGTGTYYAGAVDDIAEANYDVGLFTPAMDLTGLDDVTLTFWRCFQDFAGSGQAGVYTYSGAGMTYEEELWYSTVDDSPTSGIFTTLSFDPSTYTDPSEVYIEFWFTDDAYTGAWGFTIDDVNVYAGDPPTVEFTDTQTLSLGVGESADVLFDAWTPTALGTYFAIVETALTDDMNGDNNMQMVQFEVVPPVGPDASVISINNPTPGAHPQGEYEVCATIGNYGTSNDSITVNCTIYGEGGPGPGPGGDIFFDFEDDDGGWTPWATWDPVGDWEWTDSYDVNDFVPGGYTCEPPDVAHSGDGLWGTVINGPYTNSGGETYISQTFDFSGFAGTEMRFWYWSDLFGSWDYAKLYVNGVELWYMDDYHPGCSWQEAVIDLSAWDGQSNVNVTFEVHASTVVNYAGLYIDDFEISDTTLTRDTLLSTGFEDAWVPDGDGDLAPPGWEVIKYNPYEWWQQDTTYVHSGTYSAGMWWDYDPQDEWLITPSLDLTGYTDTELTFWTYGYRGSTYGDHYYVKVSTNGGASWTPVFDLSALSGGWNYYDTPYTVDLSAYDGMSDVLVAFHADGVVSVGLWWVWYIDDVAITATGGGPGPGPGPNGTVLYLDEQVVNIPTGTQQNVCFTPLWQADPGNYTICVTVNQSGDIWPPNDQMCIDVVILPGGVDVATDAIKMPYGGASGETYPQGTPLTFEAIVANYGEYMSTFDATLDIPGARYTETITVENLMPGATRKVTFSAITPSVGTYTATVEVYKYGDQEPANDVQSVQFSVAEDLEGEPWSDLYVTLDPDGYYTSASTFYITGYDDQFPVEIHYIIDDGPEMVGNWNQVVHFQLNELYGFEPGLHEIEYWAVDLATNEESPHNVEEYYYDDEAPAVSLTFDGVYEVAASGYYQIAPTTLIQCTAEDAGVGVKKVEYRIGNGDWILYTGPITLPEGVYELYVLATDHMKNIDGEHYRIQVGGGQPQTTCVTDPASPNGQNGWFVSDVTVTLEAYDEISGVSHTLYRLDNGDWTTYTGPFVVSEGAHTLEYYSVDNAGNAERVNTRDLNVDLYAPDITIEKPKTWLYIADRAILPLPGDKPVIIGKLTITVTVEDTKTSGVGTTELYIDQEFRAEGGMSLQYTLDETIIGPATITIVTYDVAGNQATKELKAHVFNLNILG
jgi:hypothetical protein